MKLRNRKYRLEIGAVIFFFAVVAIVGLWLLVWPGLRIQRALQVYPHAQRVSEGYGYYGADTGLTVLYYWTSDSLQDVQNYYEKFTPPFVLAPQTGTIMTVFSVDGSELVAYGVDGNRLQVDFRQNPRCQYTQANKCMNVSLFSINQNLSSLPDLIG